MTKLFVFLISINLFTIKIFGQVITNYNNTFLISNRGYFNQPYSDQIYRITNPDSLSILVAEEEDKLSLTPTPYRFAMPIPTNIDVVKLASWVVKGEYAFGKLSIYVPNAKSLSLNFNNFKLPNKTEMYIYNEGGEMITGPITDDQNNAKALWGSAVYKFDFITIEIRTPSELFDSLSLNVFNVAYGYKEIFHIISRDYGNSSSCNINILCPFGYGWEQERKSVVLTLNDLGYRWCTGALINNTCNLDIPYFLTANHCLDNGQEDVNLWRFIFNYWSPVCIPPQDGSTSLMYIGSTLKANSSLSDFALLELAVTPSANSNVYYSGWSRELVNTNSTLIHHPAGDVMKISKDYQAPVQAFWDPPGTPPGAECWKVTLDTGATNGGSSGCPFYNEDHKIIGQLYGTAAYNDPCAMDNSNNVKYGGRFNVSWTGEGTNSTRLSYWLDPNDLNLMTMNGRLPSLIGGRADLVIINQSATPTSVTAGNPIIASFVEKNAGTQTASANYVNFHLSADNILTPGQNGDIYLGQYFVNQSLSPNSQTALLTKELTIPLTVPTGTYYLFYAADGSQLVTECDELNNFATIMLSITGVTQYADLIVQNATVSPSTISPGGQATASCKNKNQGTVTAQTSWTAVWLSKDQVFNQVPNGTPADINLNADIAFPSLAAGQVSALLSHLITIPSGTECGSWYIMFGADATNQVPEGTNETNNQVFVPITVACALMCNNDYSCGPPAPPQLPITTACSYTSCSTVGAHPPSQDIPITCGGNQYQTGRYDDDVWFKIIPSNSSQITITVDPTSNPTNFDPVIGLYSGACLTPTQLGCADEHPSGETEVLVFTPTSGTTYLIRIFGYGIGGSYSGNFDICVTTPGTPDPADLVILNQNLSTYSLCPDATTTISYNIQNIGGTTAPASTVKYYLSTNNSYSGSDDLLGSTSVSTLNINQSLSKTKTLTIPTGTSAGTWYILIIADANNTVPEGSNGEANNVVAVPIQVLSCSGVPDLVISYNSHTPTTVTPGTHINLNFTAENIGTDVAASNYIGIYISSDNNFNPANDTYIDNWFQNSLDPGEVDIDGLNFEIPNCSICGSFYIFFVIDYQDIINESNNDNNDDFFPITISGCTSCVYSVPPTGISFGSAGGSGNIQVTTTLCCPWAATTANNWIHLVNASGTGAGLVTYTVDPCSGGGTRNGTIIVAGQSHQISQNCTESCNASQTFSWAVQAGSATLSDAAADLAIDASGNLYMTGDIQGSANFGSGIILTTPSTAPDIFVSKHNSSGQIQWAINYGNTAQEEGMAIATDSDNNIYVTGYFRTSITFGSTTLSSNIPGEDAAFIIKLNPSGVLQWAQKINPTLDGRPNDIVIDESNNIFVVGYVGSGLFVAKHNSSGTQLSYNTYGFGTYTKNAYGIAIDNNGNLFISGRYLQTITLGPFTLTAGTTLDMDGYIAKINSSGTVIWAKKLSSPGQGTDALYTIAVDANNNIYTVGQVDSTAIVGNITIPLSDGMKFIIIKFDNDGNPIWAKASPNGFQANKMRIIKGNDNDFYFAGGFSTSMQIDSFSLNSNGSGDAFMARIDASSKIIWLKGFGGTLSDNAAGLSTDAANNVFVAGGFRGTVAFDNTVLTSYGSDDIYLAKFKQCDPPIATITYTGPPVICPGQTLTLTSAFCSTNVYQWKLNSIDIPGAQNPTYVATEPGTYKVNVSAYSGCETLSNPVAIADHGSYTFTGNGNWSVPNNWMNNSMPPSTLPGCFEIFINHQSGGQCILNVPQTLSQGAKITVLSGKILIIPGDMY